jgi:exosortase/archaeosortase family protein
MPRPTLKAMDDRRVERQHKIYILARFIGIASAIAIVLYYLPNYYFLEKITAEHSAVLMEFIGIKSTVWTQGNKVFLNEFEIERMCTGVQVITVFLGILVALPKAALKKRILAFGVVAISVYFANIARIAFEIWLLYSGTLPWSLAHYPTGLILGVFSVAFLVVVADHFLPEVGDLAFSALDGIRRT